MRLSLLLLLQILVISCASNPKNFISPEHKRAEIYYNQGTHELVKEQYTLALKHLLEANTLKPDDSRIQNNLGMAYYFKKRPERAIKYLKSSISLDPKNTDARLNLATVYLNLGNYSEAKTQFNLVLDDLTYTAQFRTYYNLGLLYLKQNKPSEALNYFKQSINENANYCPAHFQVGNLYFKNGKYAQALDEFKNASKGTCYNNPEPLYHQALTYIELKKYDTAKVKLEEIIDRFSVSKYNKLANKQLEALNSHPQTRDNKSNLPRKILTPNF